jgi:hypothetical protein
MTKSSKKHPAASLPKRPPKKTGKKGIGPLDPVEELGHLVKDEAAKETKKPRQARLPQMEDAQIEELEGAAEEYAKYRDRRIALTVDEVTCKQDLLSLMRKHGKMKYHHNGYEIERTVESEKLKVKIKKED